MIIKSLPLFLILFLTACFPQSDQMEIKDAYMLETPATFPAGAIYMVIDNHTDTDDRMVDFKTERAGRTELHTMAMDNNVMRMRRVEGYTIPADEMHSLQPMGDHVMIFDMVSDFSAGESFEATAVFEQAGEIPVTVQIRTREK